MKRRKAEWIVMRLSKKKIRDLDFIFMFGSGKRVKQIQRAYRLAYQSTKCWLERKQLRGMIFWRDERG